MNQRAAEPTQSTAGRDGLAAMAIIVLAVALIVFVITSLV